MSRGVAVAAREAGREAPRVPLRDLRSVWLQVTGTLCNLACRHCFNASGPREPWLRALDTERVRQAIAEAAALGVRELYFTGGEPFLHPDLVALLESALAVAPTTVLTNGTLIDEAVADRLAALAAASPYSLEVRVSVDGATPAENDRIRGRGTFARAMAAIRRLDARDLPPIVTATEIAVTTTATAPAAARTGVSATAAAVDRGGAGGGPSLYERLREALVAAGVRRPRLKILPVLPLGRCAGRAGAHRLTAADLEGFDLGRLQCGETRAVAEGGVYACPILAGLPEARLGAGALAGALGPVSLGHPACVTCHATGLACANA